MATLTRPAAALEPPPTRAGAAYLRWLLPFLLLAVVIVAYARTPRFGFVFDDDSIVRANPYITSSQYIPRYFTEHIWSRIMTTRKNYYRPVFLLWLLGNYLAFGLKSLGWHVTNLLLHLGNALFVYYLAQRVARSRFAGFAAAMLFALHPAQVENVAWVSASTELLGTFFVLAAFLCYLRGREAQNRGLLWYLSSLLLYALGALAKETAIIFPAIVFLDEWLGRPFSRTPSVKRGRGESLLAAFRECAPFVVVACAYLLARVQALGGLGEVGVHMTKPTWLKTLPSVLLAYVRHVVWPVGLSAFYDYPYVERFSAAAVLLPLVILAVAALLLFFAVRKSAGGQLAAVWALLPLLPALDIRVFPRGEFVHDRYLYHPMIGVALLAGLGLAWLERRASGNPAVRRAAATAVAAALAAMAFATFRQTAYWVDNFALYSRGVEIAPHNGFANNNLGAVLMARGQLDEALVLFQRGFDNDPDLWLAQYDMGLVYYETGRYPEAEAAFSRALAINPNDAESRVFLGMTYLRTGRLAQAIQSVRHGIALKPEGKGYHFALAMMLKQAGDLPGAREELLAELRRDPHHQPSLDQLRLLDQPPASSVEKR
jgi:tetratricopeptide (TPR) repeat protein